MIEIYYKKRLLKATYTYLADGTKASVKDSAGNGYDYLGSFVYSRDNDTLTFESTSFAGGRINKTNSAYDINYFITDHLGSTRVIVDNAGNIKAQKDYYPFGKEHENPNLINSTNRYTFSGKEKQTVKDLGWLDFTARMVSNSEIPMFTTQDPLAEKYYSWSPYLYCFNNPLKYVDPDGRDGIIIINDIDKSITIKANIILYSTQEGIGRDALDKAAQKYEQNIKDNWSKDSDGNAWTYDNDGKTYTVNFDVNVSVDVQSANEKNRDYNGENNYIEVVSGNDRTFTSKVSGTNNGKWASETESAAHEFGHIIGLRDRYKNVTNEDGKKRSVPDSGYENNIMGRYGKPVEQKNINAIIEKPYNNTSLFRKIFKTGIQYINKNNRENK
jgi:RHS repeat-associated protein